MPASNDYKTIIDAQTWSFIQKTEACFPVDATDQSIAQQRALYNAMCREFNRGRPTIVDVSDDAISTDTHPVPVRRYTCQGSKKNTLIIYFHGGGFIVGDLESHDEICAELCAGTGYSVASVDYRLAPEHIHPTAFNDALAAVLHECRQGNQATILCGDSAGGTLAAAVCHSLRDLQKEPGRTAIPIAGQILIYPMLDATHHTGSFINHAHAPMLTAQDVHYYQQIVTGNSQANTKALAPLTDEDLSNLPPTVVFSAECDPLASDGERYCQALTSAGGKAVWHNEPGLVHGYLRARHTVDRAKQSFQRIVESLQSLGD